MLNQTISFKNRSRSTFLKLQEILTFKKTKDPETFGFLRANKGSVTVHKMPIGTYKVSFNSKETGRTAFAYGKNFEKEYQNMIILFTIKYN